jgi:hypothetical protein
VISDEGCEVKDEVSIRIKELQTIELPNILSTEDPDNNTLIVPDKDFINEILSYTVFDRWGNRIYNTGNFKPNESDKFWKGSINGSDVVPGVYVYVIELLFKDNSINVLKGDVTVIR